MRGSVYVCLVCCSFLVACKDQAGGNDGAGKPRAASPKASPAERAVEFAAAAGDDSPEAIDWSTVVMARGLDSVATMAGMVGDDRSALVAAGGGTDPITSAVSSLSKLDYRAEGRAEAESFARHYAGVAGCKASKPDAPPLAGIDAAIAKQLSPELNKALSRVRAGEVFALQCGDATGMIVFGEGGSVIAFEPPVSDSLDLDALSKENRFVGYMDQPDE